MEVFKIIKLNFGILFFKYNIGHHIILIYLMDIQYRNNKNKNQIKCKILIKKLNKIIKLKIHMIKLMVMLMIFLNHKKNFMLLKMLIIENLLNLGINQKIQMKLNNIKKVKKMNLVLNKNFNNNNKFKRIRKKKKKRILN